MYTTPRTLLLNRRQVYRGLRPKSTLYSGQSTPFSFNSGSSCSNNSTSGYFSVDRTMEEKEKPPPSQTQRQSLPSIHEALGSDNSFSLHSSCSSTLGPPSKPAGLQPPPPTSSARDAPNPYSSLSPQTAQLRADASRSSLASVSSQGSKNASLGSPTESARTGVTSIAPSQTSSLYEFPQRASGSSGGASNGGGGFGSLSHSLSIQPQQSSPQYPPVAYGNGHWRPRSGTPDQTLLPEVKAEIVGHPDLAKRHLDIYDSETPLNEVRTISSKMNEGDDND